MQKISLEVFNAIKQVTSSKEEFVNSIVRIIVKSDGSQLSKELNALLEQYCEAHNINLDEE